MIYKGALVWYEHSDGEMAEIDDPNSCNIVVYSPMRIVGSSEQVELATLGLRWGFLIIDNGDRPSYVRLSR